MRFLHLTNGDYYFEINFKFRWKERATKMSSKINFSKTYMYLHWTAPVDIFLKGSNYILMGFFSKQNLRTAILTETSVFTFK